MGCDEMKAVLVVLAFMAGMMMMGSADILAEGSAEAQKGLKPAEGLSYDFYRHSCPQAYGVVEEKMRELIRKNPSEAAGLLRILFHDCFVQGCDASVLLRGPATEQSARPNNASLRASTLQALDNIKHALEAACPATVSCADTIALSAAIAVHLIGGPKIVVATGRRDSKSAATNQTVVANIPPPVLNISALKQNFKEHGMDVPDLVALSGAHTIGQAHCKIIDIQISPQFSTDLKPKFAANLSRICLPANNSAKIKLTAHLDFITRDVFDNSYFKNVLNKVAVFHTDAALLNASDTKQLVEQYASSKDKFFEQFKISMVKMSEIGVLTGTKGEIRKKCSTPN